MNISELVQVPLSGKIAVPHLLVSMIPPSGSKRSETMNGKTFCWNYAGS
jgi:hypothetical protein